MKLDLPYLSAEVSRHGKDKIYVRRHGRRIRLVEEPGSPEFLMAYIEALRELERAATAEPARPAATPKSDKGSMAWLMDLYFASTEFGALDVKSRLLRQSILGSCMKEPLKAGSNDLIGQCPVRFFGTKHVRRLRDAKGDLKGAANNRLKYLSAMFGWAVEAGKATSNPCRDVRKVRYATDGFHTWSIEEVAQFWRKWPRGTKPRLALDLLLFTGARRGDMVTFGRQHIRNGWLAYVPSKTKHKRRTLSEKPILPVLSKTIEAGPCGDLTFLVTEYGRPFSAAGFGNWFRAKCDEAGLPECTAHGLRKAGATILAELGASDRQLMSIYDWSSPSEATRYTRAAEKRKLAGETLRLLDFLGQMENAIVAPEPGVPEIVCRTL